MNQATTNESAGNATPTDDQADHAGAKRSHRKASINWDDPSVPVGLAPPMPRAPLVLAVIAWLGWLMFLAVTALGRGA
ncbi:MAG: hypothetical protein ACE5E6_10915 [Phycisphaerae bacterium]